MRVKRLAITTMSMIFAIIIVYFAAQSITVDTVGDYIEGNAIIVPGIYSTSTIMWISQFLLFVVFIVINLVAFRNMKALLVAVLSIFLTWIVMSIYTSIRIYTYLRIPADVVYIAYFPAIDVMYLLKDPQMYILIEAIILLIAVFVLNIVVNVDE